MRILSCVIELMFPTKIMIQQRGKFWRVVLVRSNRLFGLHTNALGPKCDTAEEASKILEILKGKEIPK